MVFSAKTIISPFGQLHKICFLNGIKGEKKEKYNKSDIMKLTWIEDAHCLLLHQEKK